MPEKGIESVTLINDAPNYFFRLFPDSHKVAYSGQRRDGEDQNFILDLDTGKKLLAPGDTDLVPLFDETIVTTSFGNSKGMGFYLARPGKNVTENDIILDDIKHKGDYQSVGRLPEEIDVNAWMHPNKKYPKHWRLLTASGENLLISDYEINYELSPPKITRIKSFAKICTNKKLKTPILSKDGQRVSALDSELDPQVTKIFRILPNGDCVEEFNLGMVTGKTDFSYDNKKITFHVDSYQNDSPDDILDTGKMNIYEMNLITGKIKQLTYFINGRAYYPNYRRDGKIVYLKQELKNNGVEALSFVTIDPEKVNPVGFATEEYFAKLENESNCSPKQSWEKSISEIGKKWFDICVQLKVDSPQGYVLARNLNSAQCQAVVQKIEDFLTRSRLLAACNGLKAGTVDFGKALSEGTKKVVALPKDAIGIFRSKCTVCHSHQIPFNNIKQMSENKSGKEPSLFWKEAVFKRIKSNDPQYRMPLGGHLSDSEINKIEVYLNSYRK